MPLPSDPRSPRRMLLRWGATAIVLAALAVAGAWFLQTTIPRHIVMASGARDGMYHALAQRYAERLAHEGITVTVRETSGAGDNARLLADPTNDVDVAFVQGGVAAAADRERIVMLAALYYEPLWVFYRGKQTLTQLDELRYKRIAIGAQGSGVRAFSEPLLADNNVTGFNSPMLPLGGGDALRALQAGEVDAMLLVGPPSLPAIWQALHDSNLKLMSIARADAYTRRFAYISKLTLPAGTIDLALRVPAQDVNLLATKAVLAGRQDLPPAIIDVLLDAALEIHAPHGYFENGDEFPNTVPVDIPVDADAKRHLHFGPSFLHRYLPFFVATYFERLIILLVPLLVLVVPLMNLVPQLLRWRMRSRVFRWYGELALLERDVAARHGELPIQRWLADLDRIELGAARIRTPASFASEAYTLREHIALVRRTVMARAHVGDSAGGA